MASFNRAHLAAMAVNLAKLPKDKHPVHSPTAKAKLSSSGKAKLNAIMSDPHLASIATSGTPPSATDPTGGTQTKSNAGGTLGWGSGFSHLRSPNIRHVLLGITAVALTAGQANAPFKATPNVGFKPDRMVVMPAFSGTVAAVQSGVRPQYVNQAAEDADMYQPLSYGGELDLDSVKAAVSIVGQVTNANATAAQTFYGCFVGEATGTKYRTLTSKLQVGSLGTSGSVSANGTGSLTLTPLLSFTARKVLFTPGSAFSDAFIITSITCGVQPQLMSGDPIPASVFSDLFPLFVDFDPCKPAVPLTVNYQNVSGGAAVLKGSTRGDCDPEELASYAAGLDDVSDS